MSKGTKALKAVELENDGKSLEAVGAVEEQLASEAVETVNTVLDDSDELNLNSLADESGAVAEQTASLDGSSDEDSGDVDGDGDGVEGLVSEAVAAQASAPAPVRATTTRPAEGKNGRLLQGYMSWLKGNVTSANTVTSYFNTVRAALNDGIDLRNVEASGRWISSFAESTHGPRKVAVKNFRKFLESPLGADAVATLQTRHGAPKAAEVKSAA